MIDDLITMQTTMPPDTLDDLGSVPRDVRRLSILGGAKNLERLSEFQSLEALWVGDVKPDEFAKIVSMVDPEYLMLNGMRIEDLSALVRLRRLKALELIWNTRLTDIAFLRELPALRLLGISDCVKVRDINPIAAQNDLEVLDLSGGMWSVFRPETLQPLAGLTRLWGLSMTNIRVGDQSLEPVAGLKALRKLELSNQFPTLEYARLSVALPDTECTHFEPYFEVFHGRGETVMVTGKGKPVLTLPKDQARLDKYVAQFRALQEGFRPQYGGGQD